MEGEDYKNEEKYWINSSSLANSYNSKGTVIGDKANWIYIAHIGIIGLDSITLSRRKLHYTNPGIKGNITVSFNLVNEDMIIEADYVEIVSGKTVDKSQVNSPRIPLTVR